MRRLLVRTLACGVLLVGVTACSTAQKDTAEANSTLSPVPTTIPPSVTVSSNPVSPGQHVVLYGNGWQPAATLHAWLRPQDETIGIPIDLGSVTADPGGRFTETLNLPPNVATGQWNVDVYGSARSGESATQPVTVKQVVAQATGQAQATVQASAVPVTRTPFVVFLPSASESLSQSVTTAQPLAAGTGAATVEAMPATQPPPTTTPATPPPATQVAAAGTPQRIDFAPGSASVTIPVQAGGGSPVSWVLWVLQGQTMTVTTQPAAQITVANAQGQVLASASGTLQLPVQQTGDYTVSIVPSVPVTVTISIPPLQ